jgi:aldehyde:ferredoxin oxidoreductase
LDTSGSSLEVVGRKKLSPFGRNNTIPYSKREKEKRRAPMEEQVPGGYNGKILRVNLSKERCTTEKIAPSFCRKYVGGTGFVAHTLLTELVRGVDPLGPGNKLIFALGPLTGLALGGCARHGVGAKSPLTGGVAKSEAGEHWGSQLKRAGFDALILEGKARRPVYLTVQDGEAELRDASSLWGRKTKETQEAIRTELGDERVRVAMIGPGGENLVKYACIMHGPFDAAGRGGLGAVMGSKNLKAVAVRGSRMPAVHDSEGVRGVAGWLKENLFLVTGFSEYGTGSPMAQFEALGNLPVRNFRDSGFERVNNITAQNLKETIRVGMEACFACPVRCKKTVECTRPYRVDRAYGGPEYETLGALGSTCGIDDLAAIAKGSELCNAYSLDTISTGVTIAFAMECFENGLLSLQDTGGIELRFGNGDAMVKMIERIARREGVGEVLAEGSSRAARKIGKGAEAFAMQVKNLEIPMHEPRLNSSLGLGYMVNPHGADHMDSLIDIFFCALTKRPDVVVPDAVPMGFEPAPFEGIGPRKVALFKVFQSKRIILDSLLCCHFLPYSFSQLAELTSAVTGWETSTMELCRMAERILTMCRLFNVREGLSSEHDRLPERFFHPTKEGPLAGRALNPGEMNEARGYYYYLMGWDERGVPLKQKLDELGIEHLDAKK